MKERSLAVHLEQFDQKDKAVICCAMNLNDQMGYEVHQGMLPFIKADDALTSLVKMNSAGTKWRRAATLIAKIQRLYGIDGSCSFNMYLNNKKVARRFGAHPERGHVIQGAAKKRVTVGVRWSLPKRRHEPDDNVLVQPHVVLKCISGCQWHITCEKRYVRLVQEYLMNWCM